MLTTTGCKSTDEVTFTQYLETIATFSMFGKEELMRFIYGFCVQSQPVKNGIIAGRARGCTGGTEDIGNGSSRRERSSSLGCMFASGAGATGVPLKYPSPPFCPRCSFFLAPGGDDGYVRQLL